MAARGPATITSSWFGESLFNLLIDYYPEVAGRPYGSGATRENILPVLEGLRPGFVVVYAKGHSGRTTFPSALRTQHVMLAKNMPAFFRELTRETGTKLVLYYSGLMDGVAGLRHPDWRQLDPAGKPTRFFDDRYEWFLGYPICPLSPYFEEWVTVHIRELFEVADPDGIWVDGDWTGPCYCPRCVGRFRAEIGFDGPMPPPRDLSTPAGVAWASAWSAIVDDWWGRLSGLIKSLNPACLYSSGNGSARAEFSHRFDWRSGDFLTPYNPRLRQTIMMRRYTTQGLPYDAMTGDTGYLPSRPRMRSRTKSLQRMLQEGAGVLANGGQWCYWTYPMPNGALVPSKIRRAKLAAEFARERQDVFLHTESARWTAVLDVDPVASPPGTASLPGDPVFGAAKALIELHRSPDVMDENAVADDMPYHLVVVPEQRDLEADTVARLERFVAGGGCLLSSGASISSPEMQRLLGVRLVRRDVLAEGHVFLGSGEPAGVYAPWDRIEPAEAEVLYPLYRSSDDDNPEIRMLPPCYPINGMVDEEQPEPAGMPGATVRRLEQGLAVHVPTGVFATFWRYGYPDVLAWLRELLDLLQPDPLFRTDAPACVEIALRTTDDALLVHFVNGNPGRDLSWADTDDLWVDDVPAIGPITSWIRCNREPRDARWHPGDVPADVAWENGALRVSLPRLEIHTCLAIRGWTAPALLTGTRLVPRLPAARPNANG